jgi:hypothetical protein
LVHQRIRVRFESEATPSTQPAAGGVRRARRARMFGPKNKNKNKFNFRASPFWTTAAHDQLVLGSFTAAIVPSQIQATDCSSLNQAIVDCVEMDTETSKNNSPPNQDDEDRPLFGDFDFPFEETIARYRAKWSIETEDSDLRFTFAQVPMHRPRLVSVSTQGRSNLRRTSRRSQHQAVCYV